MAILTHLPGIEVTIKVDGQPPLPEHRERQLIDPSETISRYIEVRSDQNFEIHIKTSLDAMRGAGHKWFVYVDGHKTDWGLVEPRHCINAPKISISAGTHRREGLTRPYKFHLFTTDDDGSKERTKQTTQLGTIEVRIHTVSTVERLPAAPHPAARERTFAPGVPSPHEPLAEKAVKFQELSHTVGFGDAVPARRKGVRMTRVVYESSIPMATYRFYYRSKESLQNLHIIAPTPPALQKREAAGEEDIKQEDQD